MIQLIKSKLAEFLGCVEAYPLRALYFFSYASSAVGAGAFFLLFLEKEGFSGKQLGYVSGVAPLVLLVAQPLFGLAADRFGRRLCLNIAMLGAAALYFAMYWMHGFWPLFLMTAALSIFAGAVMPLIDAVALDFVDARGKLSYSMLRLWGAIGAAAGAAIVGRLVQGHATRNILLWAMAALASGWLLGLFARFATPTHAASEISWANLRPVVRNKILLAFLFVELLAGICSMAIWSFLGVYLNDIGGSSFLLGVTIAIQGLAEIPFYFLANTVLKRFGTHLTLVVTLACTTLRLFAYAANHNPALVPYIELSNGISWSLFWVASVQYTDQLVKREWRATGQSLLWACYSGAGAILGSLWCGYLYDYFKTHLASRWFPLPAHRMFLASALVLAVVTLGSIVVFREVLSNGSNEKLVE